MTYKIWAFDLDSNRIESLNKALRPKYTFRVVRDVHDLPPKGEISAIIVDTDFGSHFCEAIADFAAEETIPLFVWAPLGGAQKAFSSNIHLLPLPFSPEDVRERLNNALEVTSTKCLLAALGDRSLADSIAFSLKKHAWRTIFVNSVQDVKAVLATEQIHSIITDLDLAESAVSHNPFEPRPSMILLVPFDYSVRSAIKIDNKTAILSNRLDPEILAEMIESIHISTSKFVLDEISHLKALEDAEINRQKAATVLDMLVESARDETQGRRSEELNLLNLQTKGLVSELFETIEHIISKAQTISSIPGFLKVAEDAFSMNSELARAKESFEALRAVEWFKRETPLEPVDILKTINRAAAKVRANRRRKSIEWNITSDEFGWITANSDELEECFVNIFTNSYEAISENGRIEISVLEENDCRVIQIKDSGAGIPGDILPKVIKPYFTTKSAAHAGLGLTISSGIIKSLGGHLSVFSQAGEGTTIKLILPWTKSSFGQETKDLDFLIVAHKRTVGYLETALVRFGHRIESIDNIGEAVQIVKKNRPKAILVLAALRFLEVDGLQMLIDAKSSSKLIVIDPTESLPKDIVGLDSVIRGTFPLHHLLAIINSFIID